MSARVLETLHSGFTVADVRRLAAFFSSCFGFTVTAPRRAPAATLGAIIGVDGAVAKIVYVTAPGHVIELLQYLEPASATASAPRPCDVGFSHLSFLVDDLDGVVRQAVRHGFAATAAMPRIAAGPHAGRRASYLRDAQGFTIELMAAD